MPSKPSPMPEVVVVMCTHNGADWVEEQLKSLLSQTYPVAIRVFDDASSDTTVAKVLALRENHNIQCTERAAALGFVENFSNGIQAVLNEGFQYIALADQDDIWLADRIERGMKTLLTAEAEAEAEAKAKAKETTKTGTTIAIAKEVVTAKSGQANSIGAHLVHSNLTMVNADNTILHASYLDWRDYQINEAKSLTTILGQNGVMGNTVLMNANLARLALPFPSGLHVHDYWLALVAELLGKRHYLPECLVRYRIHEKNASNSARKVSLGADKWSKNWSFKQFFALDLKLPFKEDTRTNAIATLLTDVRFNAITADEKEIIRVFLRYLNFSENRFKLLKIVFKYDFFRPNIFHRLRVFVNILTTRRYKTK